MRDLKYFVYWEKKKQNLLVRTVQLNCCSISGSIIMLKVLSYILKTEFPPVVTTSPALLDIYTVHFTQFISSLFILYTLCILFVLVHSLAGANSYFFQHIYCFLDNNNIFFFIDL